MSFIALEPRVSNALANIFIIVFSFDRFLAHPQLDTAGVRRISSILCPITIVMLVFVNRLITPVIRNYVVVCNSTNLLRRVVYRPVRRTWGVSLLMDLRIEVHSKDLIRDCPLPFLSVLLDDFWDKIVVHTKDLAWGCLLLIRCGCLFRPGGGSRRLTWFSWLFNRWRSFRLYLGYRP